MNEAFFKHASHVLENISDAELAHHMANNGIPAVAKNQHDYKSIIWQTSHILAEMWDDAKFDPLQMDASKLQAYHDTLDVSKMEAIDAVALLRCSFRVRSIYPHWYELRAQVLELLKNDHTEPEVRKMLRGLMGDPPEMVPGT